MAARTPPKRITTYAIMATLSGVTASRRPAVDVQLKEAILRDVYQIAEKLKEVLSLSGDNTDIIEGFVAICQDASCKKGAFSVPLLRRCIGLTTAQNEPDKLVKYYHLLFQALLDARDEDGLVALALFEDEMDQQSTTNDDSA
ncbi:hypothetical protein MRX96_005101 [Rhipicephalus microplus]